MSIFSPEVIVDNTVLVDGSAVTQPVSAASLPLPSGAATEASVAALTKPSDIQLVDGSATIQPVSGTVTASVSNFPATQPVSGTITVANPGLTDTQLRASAVPVSGTVAVSSVSGSVAVTGPLTDTQLRATPVPISGTVSIGAASAIATVTSVTVSPVVATLSVSNVAKTKVIVHNETGTLFVKLGSGASSSSYSYRLTANTVLEISGYTGIVTATKVSGTTDALVTEVGI
jgi:hypothetical protein